METIQVEELGTLLTQRRPTWMFPNMNFQLSSIHPASPRAPRKTLHNPSHRATRRSRRRAKHLTPRNASA